MTHDEMELILDAMEEFIDMVFENYPQNRRTLIMGSLQWAGLGSIPPEDLEEYRREQRELWS